MVDQEQLERYAQIILRIGLVFEPGERLVVRASLESAPLVRALTRQAYAAGAENVDVLWSDPEVTRARFTHGRAVARPQVSADAEMLLEASRRGLSVVRIFDVDPQLLDDIDPAHVAEHEHHVAVALRDYRERTAGMAYPWVIAAASTRAWAGRVFPELDRDAAVERLWQAILATCRVGETDPILAWEEHLAQLDARRAYLDERRYDRLHYVGPGTDLTLGLPAGHCWITGKAGPKGVVPNLPTEEVFTSPDRLRADGVVRATKPLSWFGTMIEGISLRFSGGAVIEAHADHGQAALDRILESDDGAVRLGEAALVPQSSLVAAQGLVWRNILFDENDACHLALGQGFPMVVPGGSTMSPDDLVAAGINRSDTHVDFVVGSAALDIYGLAADGTAEPILRQGEWAFEA